MEKLDFDDLLSLFIQHKNLHRTEGRKGVENLCRIVRALGYRDSQHFGQLDHDCCIGDLIDFLEDNSGVIDVVIEKIAEFGDHNNNWYEELETHVSESDEDEEDSDEE